MKYARRLGIGLACTFAFFGGIAGYRAIVQIYRVELQAPDTLRAGSEVHVGVTTSGRVTSSATLVLVQGMRVDTLRRRVISDNHIGWFISQSINPFPVRDSMTVLVSPEVLARFDAGPATLRAIGLGASQWMRVPPPTVRERNVMLVR
jgi:hypothetical protein